MPPQAPIARVIRRAGPADAGAVRALTRAAYAKWVAVIGREPLPMRADYDAAVRRHVVDMVVEAATPVALVELVVRPDDVLIENLAVSPDHQGRGLGRDLLAHAERVVAEAGHATVRLYTNALCAENIAFYGRHGYRVEREEPFMGGTTVHMVKTLDRAA